MNTRRDFLKTSGGALAASLLPWNDLFAQAGLVNKVGIQLFSLPKCSIKTLQAQCNSYLKWATKK
jgi:hypothetical protein